MLSQVRRGHHQGFDGSPMYTRTINNQEERWRHPDRNNPVVLSNKILPDHYPIRSNSTVFNPDLSRALRIDAYLLAIIRIEDKRSPHYSAEVVSKLRHKERTHSFINKPCSLYVNDRFLFIIDRITQVVAETIPLEHLDPTCVQSDTPDTLNDIFMYRTIDRSSMSNDHSTVVVFKCAHRESKTLVDSIRNPIGRQNRQIRSARSQTRANTDRSLTEGPLMPNYNVHPIERDAAGHNNSTYVVGPQYPVTPNRAASPKTKRNPEYYKQQTEELNKCFDDIEQFVRYIEGVTNYTKSLDRSSARQKDKKSNAAAGNKTEKLPDAQYFIDILQKFKHSFNLIGDLGQVIQKPNGAELIHYLLTPLQLILYTLREKMISQPQLAQSVWTPALTKNARELLLNCLTSKEVETLRSLGPAWIRAAEETPSRVTDYKPVFYEGYPFWLRDESRATPAMSARSEREESQKGPVSPSSPISPRINSGTNGSSTTTRSKPMPTQSFESSTIDRSTKPTSNDSLNSNYQNEHAWAIERQKAGAKMCAVRHDRTGQNNKELTVHQGQIIEILNHSKKWWKARNFQGVVGHVPHNIVEEIVIEKLSATNPLPTPSEYFSKSSSVPTRGYPNGHVRAGSYSQFVIRSPSNADNFIMQSSNATSTKPSIRQDAFFNDGDRYPLSTSPVPMAPALPVSPPPPPAPPMPDLFNTPQSSPWSTLKIPDSSRTERSRITNPDATPRNEELRQELTQRITDRVGFINEKSTKDEVQRWLISKQISAPLVQKLRDLNGEQLFHLTKESLDQLTDETESNRLFALLDQQRQLAGHRPDETLNRSDKLNNGAFGSLKSNRLKDVNEPFSMRTNDTLSRSLKIKLKQRRDKLEQAENTAQIDA